MAAPPDWVTLRIFLAAVEQGSVTRAAARCGIAVSAAVKRLQELEADHSTLLLNRTSRGVRATPAGEALARHARVLLDLAARLADDMRAHAAGGRGSLRLHTTASAITGHRLAEALAGFAKAQPEIRVELREATSFAILRDLVEGRADLGIVTSGGPLPEALAARPWHEDHLLAVLPATHRFAGRKALRFAEVLDEPLIGVLTGSALALLLAEEAARLGRAPRYRFQVEGTDAARHLIAAGHGVGVMPEGAVRPYEVPLGLRGVRLAEPWAQRRLTLVTRAGDGLAGPVHLLLGHLAAFSPPARGGGATAPGSAHPPPPSSGDRPRRSAAARERRAAPPRR